MNSSSRLSALPPGGLSVSGRPAAVALYGNSMAAPPLLLSGDRRAPSTRNRIVYGFGGSGGFGFRSASRGFPASRDVSWPDFSLSDVPPAEVLDRSFGGRRPRASSNSRNRSAARPPGGGGVLSCLRAVTAPRSIAK
jgi:hypothetical protein